MIDYQLQAILECRPMATTAATSVRPQPSCRLRKTSVIVAIGLALLATLPSAVRPAAADEGMDAVAGLLRGLEDRCSHAGGARRNRPAAGRDPGVRAEMRYLPERFGERPAVARALQRIETQPGRTLFTSPETISELERIVGGPIHLGQSDLELCVQLRDRRVGAAPGASKPASFAAIDARLGKCLAHCAASVRTRPWSPNCVG